MKLTLPVNTQATPEVLERISDDARDRAWADAVRVRRQVREPSRLQAVGYADGHFVQPLNTRTDRKPRR